MIELTKALTPIVKELHDTMLESGKGLVIPGILKYLRRELGAQYGKKYYTKYMLVKGFNEVCKELGLVWTKDKADSYLYFAASIALMQPKPKDKVPKLNVSNERLSSVINTWVSQYRKENGIPDDVGVHYTEHSDEPLTSEVSPVQEAQPDTDDDVVDDSNVELVTPRNIDASAFHQPIDEFADDFTLNLEEAADMLGLGKKYFGQKLRGKKFNSVLKVVRRGRQMFFSESQIKNYIKVRDSYFTATEVAQLLNISIATIYARQSQSVNNLQPWVFIGRACFLYNPADVEKFQEKFGYNA